MFLNALHDKNMVVNKRPWNKFRVTIGVKAKDEPLLSFRHL